jgi:hypothetical protein
MARITLNDGTTREVDYNTAAKINDIKRGLLPPDNMEQRVFVSKVTGIDFEDLSEPTPMKLIEVPRRAHDKQMDKILANRKLRGIEKARAVIERIKERNKGKGV